MEGANEMLETAYFLLLFILCPGFIINSPVQIVDLAEKYAVENTQGCLQLLINVFGATFNSGLYRSANVSEIGLHINLSINGMISYFSDDPKTFRTHHCRIFLSGSDYWGIDYCWWSLRSLCYISQWTGRKWRNKYRFQR